MTRKKEGSTKVALLIKGTRIKKKQARKGKWCPIGKGPLEKRGTQGHTVGNRTKNKRRRVSPMRPRKEVRTSCRAYRGR